MSYRSKTFTPLVFFATGGMDHKATVFYKRLASLVSDEWKEGTIMLCCCIGGGDRGPWPPHFFGTLFARKDRDTLIEQSGYEYSNRAVTLFREAV